MFTRNSIVLSNNIKTPLTALSKAVGNILQLTYGQLVKQLFANNEQGFAYDPNDLSTLYQDAAGTIPVTAAGQPVGLMLDKSKGLSLSSNINSVTNIESVPIGGAAFNSYPIGGNSVAGKAYLFEFAVTDYSGTGNVTVSGGGSQWLVNPSALPSAPASNVTYKVILFALVSAPLLFFTRSTNQCKFSNISVKELAGNHAYQTVSASRPILQQTPILGTTEYVQNGKFDSDISGWGVIGSSTTKTVAWESGALKVSASTTGTCVSSGTLSTLLVIGKTYEVSCECLAHDATGGLSGVFIGDGAQTVGNVTGTGKFKFLVTATLNTSKINFGRVGSGVASEVFSKWDNISIKEVTGYRTDQNYLQFDGVDDFLQTNNIDFTATDKISLFAGVRKLSDGIAAIVELSNNIESLGNTGAFLLAVRNTSYAYFSKGTVPQYGAAAQLTSLPTPDSSVFVAKSSISTDLTYVRANNSVSATAGVDQGTGNYGNYPLYIGRRAGTSIPFTGHVYGLIGIGRLTTDSETIALEKAIAKNVGVTLNV